MIERTHISVSQYLSIFVSVSERNKKRCNATERNKSAETATVVMEIIIQQTISTIIGAITTTLSPASTPPTVSVAFLMISIEEKMAKAEIVWAYIKAYTDADTFEIQMQIQLAHAVDHAYSRHPPLHPSHHPTPT